MWAIPHLSHILLLPAPCLGQYQIILPGDRVCEQFAQGCYLTVKWLGVKPATTRSQFWCPNHYTMKPHQKSPKLKITNNPQQINLYIVIVITFEYQTCWHTGTVDAFPYFHVLLFVFDGSQRRWQFIYHLLQLALRLSTFTACHDGKI